MFQPSYNDVESVNYMPLIGSKLPTYTVPATEFLPYVIFQYYLGTEKAIEYFETRFYQVRVSNGEYSY